MKHPRRIITGGRGDAENFVTYVPGEREQPLRERARAANAIVREREADAAPTRTQALAVIGGMSLPVEAVEEYQTGENGGLRMLGYRGWVNLDRFAATIAVVRVS